MQQILYYIPQRYGVTHVEKKACIQFFTKRICIYHIPIFFYIQNIYEIIGNNNKYLYNLKYIFLPLKEYVCIQLHCLFNKVRFKRKLFFYGFKIYSVNRKGNKNCMIFLKLYFIGVSIRVIENEKQLLLIIFLEKLSNGSAKK